MYSVDDVARLPPEELRKHGKQPSRGLGDTLAKILAAVGIRKRAGCGCGKRQAALNRLFPYRKRV